jgi:hypothetical protein
LGPARQEPRPSQGRPAVIGQGAADGVTVAPNDFRLGIRSPLQLAFERADAADTFLQFLLGMAIGFVERPGGLTQVMGLAELVRHPRQGSGHGVTDRLLAVRAPSGSSHGPK